MNADSSSDDEATSRARFASPPKRHRSHQDPAGHNVDDLPPRSTVIVSPAKPTNSALPSMFTFNTSSQESDSSDEEEDITPSIHKVLIKPKASVQPVIDEKAKIMMVGLLVLV